MKLKPWMYVAAGLAALWFLTRKKALPANVEPFLQTQNLFVDP